MAHSRRQQRAQDPAQRPAVAAAQLHGGREDERQRHVLVEVGVRARRDEEGVQRGGGRLEGGAVVVGFVVFGFGARGAHVGPCGDAAADAQQGERGVEEGEGEGKRGGGGWTSCQYVCRRACFGEERLTEELQCHDAGCYVRSRGGFNAFVLVCGG